MQLTIVSKLSIGVALLVIASTGIVGSLFYYKTTDLLIERSAKDISNKINDASSRLQASINTLENDTLFLSKTPPIQGMIRAAKNNNADDKGKSTYNQWRERLQSIFTNILKSKSVYIKIRIIDKNGQELIVVRNDNHKIKIMTEDKLQNKKYRNYTKETLALSINKIYLSEITLNREHGKVSIPHQQVLRSATPIFDEENNKISGLLIITSEIGHAFNEIQKNAQNDAAEIYITNDKGGYLLHPDAKKSYGFDLGKRYRIQEDIPQVAPLYIPDNTDNNFIKIPKNREDKYVLNLTKIPFDQDNPKRFIAVAITKLYSDIVSKQSNTLNDVVLMAVFLTIVVIFIAVFFAHQISRPIKQITKIMDDYTHHRPNNLKIPVDRTDEIGVLAKSYASLIKQVNEGQANLEDLNKNLGTMVTERTLELESSEKFQRSIIGNMADGLITSDDNGNILSFNTAAEIIFGYKQDDIIGKNLCTLMPPVISEEHNKHFNSYVKTGIKNRINSHFETEAKRKNGETFPVDLAIREIIINSEKIFVGVLRDITERKQIERMKNEFISTVSHELRTPLTAIRGSLGLINGGALGAVPEKAAEMLLLAGNNTQRLLLLINDILDLQKMEAGEMTFDLADVNVRSFLQQAIVENQSYGNQYNVKFVLSNIEDVTIKADQHRMMQVMANLLSNAAKFSHENSSVEISAKSNKNGNTIISITDHGEGIPKEFQPKLFDKFTQSDSSSTRKTGSTGLGLSITKTIIEAHGGSIHFVSTEGEGTTFSIEIPA